jgi:hypothetical protein
MCIGRTVPENQGTRLNRSGPGRAGDTLSEVEDPVIHANHPLPCKVGTYGSIS